MCYLSKTNTKYLYTYSRVYSVHTSKHACRHFDIDTDVISNAKRKKNSVNDNNDTAVFGVLV